jgi:hypothetical protein
LSQGSSDGPCASTREGKNGGDQIFVLLRVPIQPLSRVQSADPRLTESLGMRAELIQSAERTTKAIAANPHGCFPSVRIDLQPNENGR